MPNPLSSLWTRVVDYAGPRLLSTETGFFAGLKRQLAIPQVSQTRWILSDLESAIIAADTGNLRTAGRLNKSLRRDGTIHGVMSTRTLGLVQLPIHFSGDPEPVEDIARDFRMMFPSQELARIDADGISLGIGLGEFVQVESAMPVLRRVNPEWLWYRWAEDRWYYQSLHGMIPINPGDGRWYVHFAGGVVEPWTDGLWMALSRAYIAKEHAYFYRENYNSKLANAARVAELPQGANDAEVQSWFDKVAAWGVNTVFASKPGYSVKLLESNGVGYQTYTETIESCNEEIKTTIAGQTVTTDGSKGFLNEDIFKTIRSDLIQGDADAMGSTLNGQGIPVWKDWKYGARGQDMRLEANWDVAAPKDLAAAAGAMTAAAAAVGAWNPLLASQGKEVDIDELARRYEIPTRDAMIAPAQVIRAIRSGMHHKLLPGERSRLGPPLLEERRAA